MSDPERADVLVLGAGMSGATAASVLAAAGFSVRILEARDRVGGRLFSRHEAGQALPAELGGEFVQGRIPELLNLAQAAGLLVSELVGDRVQASHGRVTRQRAGFRRVDSIFSSLPAAAAAAEKDCTFNQFLVARFSEPALARARSSALGWVMGYDAADPERVGIRFLAREQIAEEQIQGEHSFRVLSVYDSLPRWLCASAVSQGATVHTETEVTDVTWRKGEVEVLARHPTTGAVVGPFRARRVVLTLPVGVLKAGGPRFTPALETLTLGLHGLEMGAVAKVVLRFKERFWDDALPGRRAASRPTSLARVGFLRTPGQPFPTFWTAYTVQAAVLNAWCGGPPARDLSALPETAVVDRALHSLATALAIPRPRIDDLLASWQFHNWQRDPFAGGAYSYVAAGGIPAQHRFAESVADTVYMGGEAAELNGFQATVHGAMRVGRAVAAAIVAAEAHARPGR